MVSAGPGVSREENSVGNDFAEIRVREVVHVNLFGFTLRPPLAHTVFELADELLLLRIHRYHWLTTLLKPLGCVARSFVLRLLCKP